MQIGTITVDGRLVGNVAWDDGSEGTSPPVMYASLPVGRDAAAPVGGYDAGRPSDSGSRGSSGHQQEGGGRSDTSHGRHGPGHFDRHAHQHPSPGANTLGRGEDPRGMEGHIRAEAARNGVNPDTAVRVAKSEGLRDPVGDHGKSHGAFQLYKGGGLGNEFQKETGLDPADPKNEKATISWAMRNVGRTGWEPYHGAKRVGIGNRDGIGGSPSKAIDQIGKASDAKLSGGTNTSAPPRRDGRVDPRIQEIVAAAGKHLPEGYRVDMSSGYRGPASRHNPNHHGNAADYRIIDPKGNVIPNRGNDPTGMYTQLARHAHGEQKARFPELNGKFAWGGAFGTALGGGGQRDLMHFDINGERGRYESARLSRMGSIPGTRYGRPAEPTTKTANNKPFDPTTDAP